MSGYIGPQPVPQATQHREAFTATANQVSFATAGYTPQFIDIYLNGVKLAPSDYVATNGSDVVLATGAATGDILEYVAYTPFEVANQTFTGTTTTAALTVTGAFTSKGIDDNAAATAMTLDASGNVLMGKAASNPAAVGFEARAGGTFFFTQNSSVAAFMRRNTTDGDIIQFAKDGTTVGSISTFGSTLAVGNNATFIAFDSGTSPAIIPSTGLAGRDAAVDLGDATVRWKDLYLSGGVYLGGTGAANKLDDYESGTWTPGFTFSGASVGITYVAQVGKYTKVGNMVTASCYVKLGNKGSSVGGAALQGLPFTTLSSTNSFTTAALWLESISFADYPQGYAPTNSTAVNLDEVSNAGATTPITNANFANNSAVMISISYQV
jgi:hypothetical protein